MCWGTKEQWSTRPWWRVRGMHDVFTPQPNNTADTDTDTDT
jgi:hypothetical protein